MKSKRKHHHYFVSESRVVYVSNIPQDYNTIPQIYKHFSRFGHIQSVSCTGRSATLIFETVEAAREAVHSPESYAKNRFIEIKFHKNPVENAANLNNFIDKKMVHKINDEVCAKIDNETTKTLIKRYQAFKEQKGGLEGEIAKLRNAIEALSDEAAQCMVSTENACDEEKIQLKKRIVEIWKQIKETEERIKELEEMNKNSHAEE